MHFGIVLGGIWSHFYLHFAIEILSKHVLEISSIFRSFLEGFLAPLASHLAPKMCPKSIQAALGAQRGPWSVPRTLRTLKSHQKWSPKWAQDPQNRIFRRVQPSKTVPQSSQHGIPKHEISENGFWPNESKTNFIRPNKRNMCNPKIESQRHKISKNGALPNVTQQKS